MYANTKFFNLKVSVLQNYAYVLVSLCLWFLTKKWWQFFAIVKDQNEREHQPNSIRQDKEHHHGLGVQVFHTMTTRTDVRILYHIEHGLPERHHTDYQTSN